MAATTSTEQLIGGGGVVGAEPLGSGAFGGGALLSVQRTPRGHVVERLRRGERLAPRVLHASRGAVQACVLPTQAGPLSGDHDHVRIVVGADATLVVRPIAATLALPGAARTRLDLDIDVGPGARVVLEDSPLIVAAGADVERSTTVRLAAGAVAALRETVVLGRAGEPGGRLVGTLRVTDDDGVVLHDALCLEPATSRQDAHVALAPGHRVAGTLCLLGADSQDEPQLALARAGALRRASARGLAELDAELAGPWARWAQLVAPGCNVQDGVAQPAIGLSRCSAVRRCRVEPTSATTPVGDPLTPPAPSA